MKTATMVQTVIGAQPTCWVKTLSRAWGSFLFAGRPQFQQAMAAVQHRQSPPPGCWPQQSASTFTMLVESDVLRGSRSVLP